MLGKVVERALEMEEYWRGIGVWCAGEADEVRRNNDCRRDERACDWTGDRWRGRWNSIDVVVVSPRL